VVAISLFAQVRTVAGTVAALVGLALSTPAMANSSAAAADVTAPLRTAQAAKPAAQNGDAEFRRLFSDWKSLDRGLVNTTVTRAALPASPLAQGSILQPAGVSIPSRMPVESATLTSGFGMRVHPVLGGRRAHKGIDLAQPTGTPVFATADGVVSRAEWFSSYGLYISLEHGAAIQTRYGHLSRLNVASGQKVTKGDIIGYVGSTGRSTGPHLHYEVRIAGNSVNPVPYLQGDALRSLPVSTLADSAQGGPDEE